jgi:transcriptional regulator of acetoin/glycerol metabolism
MTEQGWLLTQIASGLGIDRNTVRDRLDRHGLRHTSRAAR